MKKTWFIWLVITLFYAIPARTQTTSEKKWSDFASLNDSKWNEFLEWKSDAKNDVTVFAPDSNRALFAMYEGDLDPNSMLASFILHSGGMVVDHGWIRVLGSGCTDFMRGFKDWNRGKSKPGKDGSYYLLVADDVVGGFFGIKMSPGANPDKAKVWYLGASNLQWVNTGIDYPTFLKFCFVGDMKGFYYDYRWDGWQEEVSKFSQRHTIGCYPELWTRETRVQESNRKVLDVATLWNKYQSGK